MSSSLIQDTPPGSRPTTSGGMVRLDPVTESSSSDNSSLGEVGGSGDEAQPSPSGFSTSSHGSASTKSSASRNLETLPEYRISLGRIKPLGNPTLVPFKNEWRLKKTMGRHISMYMCSSILYEGSETIHQLWDPRPTLKATDGQKRGIEVGDLVHLNDYGEVMVLFNIFHSREANVARGATPPPEPYEHLEAIFNPGSHLRLVDIQKRKTYMSNNIRLVHPYNYHQSNKMLYEFTTTKKRGDSGAIVVLPDGGVESSLNDSFFQLPLVKKHFREHAPSWYQHARLSNMKNGSLYIVRKTYCARTWGIAAFASNDYVKDPITAKLRQHGPHEYLWETQDNRLKTGVYPSGSELEALQLREPPLNQCMGVGFKSHHSRESFEIFPGKEAIQLVV
ncbi:hypothetical protein GALMADRAFT_928621 [Galerina marginata CBS 339.88]|uniref:Uncharacterized protein n=1 Tax=Galerina marginata (strain CBS 339.88) TaxID=685588 RepID=A0A067SNN6_GALM3|nr:hypothetical protein GALMADRAFT_928621 [Galerina marginata CBS 339.88]